MNMMKCLFLLCLCLFPIVVFSSSFTSQNPIELPNDSTSGKPVLDTSGKEVTSHSSYRIISAFWGALGGDVYLGESPNSDAPCLNGVFRYNSDRGPRGTPVKFIPHSQGMSENKLFNIQFDIPTFRLCVKYTIWKVGEYNETLGGVLLETGGSIGQRDSSYFKIVKSKLGYNLIYCDSTPIFCPFCRKGQLCVNVGEVFQDGRRRLALTKDHPVDVLFEEIK